MKKTVKISSLVAPTFRDAFNRLIRINFPVAVSFDLISVKKSVNDAIAKFEEVRAKLLDEYAEKNPESGEFVIDNGNYVIKDYKAFDEKVRDLLAVEVEIDCLDKAVLKDNNVFVSSLDLENLLDTVLD